MKRSTPDEQLLIRYLLGELPEAECIELEQLCLESDEVFEQLEAVEAELTDDYVRGVLVGHRRKEFEKRLLNTPGRAEEIEFARFVARDAHTRRTLLDGLKAWRNGLGRPTRFLQVSIAVATLALMVAAGLFSLRHWAPKSEVSQIAHRGSPAADREAGHTGGPAPAYTPPQPPSGTIHAFQRAIKRPVIATFTLTPGGIRGEGESNAINMPRQAKRVRFRIELPPNEYKTYSVSLRRVEGEQLFVQNNLKARRSKSGETLVIQVPAKRLSPGMSVLTLTGIAANSVREEISQYVVRIHAQ